MRFAFRALRKRPAVSLFSVALLGIGIGGGALLFSAFESVWLRTLPVRHPEQLVRLVQRFPQLGTRSNFAYPFYRALNEHSTTLSVAFGEQVWTVAMNEPAPAEQVLISTVTPEYFDALGVAALVGRVLMGDDARENAGDPPAVISHSLWFRRFHADRRAVGQSITLNKHRFRIVGVLPREFHGISVETGPDVRIPLRTVGLVARPGFETKLEKTSLELAARLRPGVTRERAHSECVALWKPFIESPGSPFDKPLELDPLDRGVSILRDKYGDALRLLTIAAGLLLLVVCANVAGLMLATAASRRGEIAVRLALGATRRHLVTQMLSESLLLVAAGTLGGILLAWTAAPLLMRALPPIRDLATNRLALSLDLTPDARVLLVLAAAVLLSVGMVGVVPALAASRTHLETVLRSVRSTHGLGGRRVLVIVQMALCTLLLAGAGLLVRTFQHLESLDPGFDRSHVVTFTTDPSLAGYTEAQEKPLWQDLMARVRDIPGVTQVAASSRPIMRGSGMKTTIAQAGQTVPASEFLNTSTNGVTLDYFDTMGIRLAAGRAFTRADITTQKPIPAIVNEVFARRTFPEGNPVGRTFGYGIGKPALADYQVMGVVRDAKYRSLREPMTPTFYTARDDGFAVLAVHTNRAPESVIQPVRQALAAIDPALPFTEIHTLAEEVETSAAPERLTASLASCFALFAALLAAAGVYGLVAFAVEQRRREFGIRMALGARPADIRGMLARQTAVMAAIGLATGLTASLLFGRWVRSLLYGVAPSDPLSLLLAVALVLLVSAAATAIPAGRAAKVEPASALRQD